MRENEFDYDINGLISNSNANEIELFSDKESVDSFDFDYLEESLQKPYKYNKMSLGQK